MHFIFGIGIGLLARSQELLKAQLFKIGLTDLNGGWQTYLPVIDLKKEEKMAVSFVKCAVVGTGIGNIGSGLAALAYNQTPDPKVVIKNSLIGLVAGLAFATIDQTYGRQIALGALMGAGHKTHLSEPPEFTALDALYGGFLGAIAASLIPTSAVPLK